jgi:hypothetical protein
LLDIKDYRDRLMKTVGKMGEFPDLLLNDMKLIEETEL